MRAAETNAPLPPRGASREIPLTPPPFPHYHARTRYAGIYLGIIVMGAFHGLMLLPVLLATFGMPDP